MVGVTSQGSEQGQQRSGSNRVSNKTGTGTGTGTGMQEQDSGPRKNTHTKAKTAGLAIT
ncbi:unnamed protein product [Staurois parvus]|uniref:Uncharacterized protein n=1 Tax=Staurois parvus TaxID=386267 RepID=A0ABN9DBH6_9NEOB|nr:unnamed protein product [Staurois parvus]